MRRPWRSIVVRAAASVAVVLVPVYVLALLLTPWVAPVGPNRSPAPGVDALPAEVWPLVVLLPLVWIGTGFVLLWRPLLRRG